LHPPIDGPLPIACQRGAAIHTRDINDLDEDV